eukprot:m.343058 g.343058  ORF g.343058 m.343058 type:complete len:171 (-) comp22269_c0_seq1:81-593(-)
MGGGHGHRERVYKDITQQRKQVYRYPSQTALKQVHTGVEQQPNVTHSYAYHYDVTMEKPPSLSASKMRQLELEAERRVMQSFGATEGAAELAAELEAAKRREALLQAEIEDMRQTMQNQQQFEERLLEMERKNEELQKQIDYFSVTHLVAAIHDEAKISLEELSHYKKSS